MPIYEYRGLNAAGERASGFVDADSPKAARLALSAQGVVADTLATPSFRGVATPPWRTRFYEGLGALLQGGFPMSQALKFLADDASGPRRGALLAISGAISSGATLADAIRSAAGTLPPFEAAALSTAEVTGSQGPMLSRLSSFMEADRRVRDNIRSALAYPAAVLCLALLLLATVAFAILPRAAALFPANAVPASVRILRAAAPVVLVAFCAAIAAAWRLVASLSHPAPGPGAARRDRLLLSLPIARRLLPCLWSSRFAATMSLLLDAGLSPQDSILPAGEATGSPLVASLAQSASASVRQGAPLSQAVASIAPLAKSLSAWFAVGEKTGSLAAMLSSAADRARNDYERALKRVLSLLEPLLVAVVGLAVLAVALAVLRPMLDLTTGAAL